MLCRSLKDYSFLGGFESCSHKTGLLRSSWSGCVSQFWVNSSLRPRQTAGTSFLAEPPAVITGKRETAATSFKLRRASSPNPRKQTSSRLSDKCSDAHADEIGQGGVKPKPGEQCEQCYHYAAQTISCSDRSSHWSCSKALESGRKQLINCR